MPISFYCVSCIILQSSLESPSLAIRRDAAGTDHSGTALCGLMDRHAALVTAEFIGSELPSVRCS